MVIQSIDDVASFCKRKGIVFANSEIYGSLAGFWDYGPAGTEIKNNVKRSWWRTFVQKREDVVGIDGSTITHPKVWVASGHVESFTDPLVDCKRCKTRLRADTLISETLNIPADGLTLSDINKLIVEKEIKCPKCKKGELTEARAYNLMFKTNVGPVEDETSVAYLRPETAQVIFADFMQVLKSTRVKLPFGICQIGRAYRNEISPRNFIFRSREFEQMEIEYFVHPDRIQDCPYINEVMGFGMNILSADDQEAGKKEANIMTVKDALNKKIIKTTWHAYWLAQVYGWFLHLSITPGKLRARQHLQKERSHYALDTWDIEYNFPFGWKEIHGMANRTTFDLTQHKKHSGENIEYFDEETKEKVVPYVVAEPSQGVDRAILTFLVDCLEERDGKNVLKLHPDLAPYIVAVFPLLGKDGLPEKARPVYKMLNEEFTAMYDDGGSIGKRYARADEIGIPFCLTVDYQTLEDETVTIRERDTTVQSRVKICDLESEIKNRIKEYKRK